MNLFISFDLVMLRTIYRHLFFLLLLFPVTQLSIHAQNLTGIWRGYFITNAGEKYKLEFQINGSSPNFSSGVSYSYLDVRFYGKATMTGSFTRDNKNLKIREIKTVEIKNMDGGGACIMNYDLFYEKSGKEEFLEGTFLGKPEVKGRPNPYSWGDCGGGKVYLRRVTTSDFYIEPFLRGKIKTTPVIINQPPIKKDTVKSKPTTPPVKKPVVNTKPVENKPIVKNNPPIVNKPKTDTAVTKINPPPIVKTNPPVIVPKPAVLKNRTNELMKSLIVTNRDIIVKLYDNGEIDDDTISVYLDNKLMLSSKRLSAAPLTIKFTIDEGDSDHELIMVAENLGRIPPNTSLMVVEAGEQRFEVRITSTEQKNAVVRFRYRKPD
ncbi:MAG: hypothetical protein IPP02_06410 [Chitinophagaceae bacterium]|nr:hypothetical protein [Chitinophagaceae bacterium]MBK9464780.1 hypothetical protein [Chitinophagaceae bacterium]MBK9938014.1 hypothetical protein [Chitinophagaceae bacterium]MBP6232121.1 hypothetical protein [Chitinophagaceae bacterium]MBP6415193.1 hypothetical protein [Chitinophagaceae bacterium]